MYYALYRIVSMLTYIMCVTQCVPYSKAQYSMYYSSYYVCYYKAFYYVCYYMYNKLLPICYFINFIPLLSFILCMLL